MILVINSKGGTGKSTVSQQVLCAWLYERTGKKVKLIEIDDVNFDSEVFLEKSKVIDAELVKRNEYGKRIRDVIFDDVVVDVGGNITAESVLDYLILSGLINAIQMVVIVVSQGEQDAVNALKIYKMLNDVDFKNIVLCLNRYIEDVSAEIQYPFVYGFDDISGYFEGVDIVDIKVLNSELVNLSRFFGMTIYELSQYDLNSLDAKIKEAVKAKDLEKLKRLSEKKLLVNRAKRFVEYIRDNAFVILDKLIGGGDGKGSKGK